MPVERWNSLAAGACIVLGTIAAVLLGGVSHVVLARPDFVVALAAPGPQARPSPFSQRQAGPGKALAPGTLLIASRGLIDPNFLETVIVLVDHTEEGTAGLVVNRQTDVALSRVFQKLPQAQRQSAPVFLGGPVSTNAVQALVRSAAVAQGRPVTADIHVIGTPQGLEERLTGKTDPSQFRVYLGYAGWAPGQLEQEIGAGAWHILPAESDVVFDPDPDTLWHRQIRRTELILARRAGEARPVAWTG